MATSYDGVRRQYEATAYPLFGTGGEMHGVISVFWQDLAGEPRSGASRVLGRSGIGGRSGADTVKYGGNTSCVEVRLASGHSLILDAGTGIRPLGVLMQDDLPSELHILLTHLHLDHLQGLGFFRPLFVPGPRRPHLGSHLTGPAPFRADRHVPVPSTVPPPTRGRALESDLPRRHGGADDHRFGYCPSGQGAHQGPTVGYRIEEGGRVLVYIPDHEPALGTDLASMPESG